LAGSILLAGILLKLGGYGFIRFSVPLCPQSYHLYSVVLQCLALISIIYGGLNTIRQSDMKRLIAYSSVAHMGFATYVLFTQPIELATNICIVLLVAHGLVSPALFMICGVIYERYFTRIMKYYGGLVSLMPITATICFLFTLCSIAFPCSLNFIGEALCV